MHRMISSERQPIDYVAPDPAQAANDEIENEWHFDVWRLGLVAWVMIGISATVGGMALYWVWQAMKATAGVN